MFTRHHIFVSFQTQKLIVLVGDKVKFVRAERGDSRVSWVARMKSVATDGRAFPVR